MLTELSEKAWYVHPAQAEYLARYEPYDDW